MKMEVGEGKKERNFGRSGERGGGGSINQSGHQKSAKARRVAEVGANWFHLTKKRPQSASLNLSPKSERPCAQSWPGRTRSWPNKVVAKVGPAKVVHSQMPPSFNGRDRGLRPCLAQCHDEQSVHRSRIERVVAVRSTCAHPTSYRWQDPVGVTHQVHQVEGR